MHTLPHAWLAALFFYGFLEALPSAAFSCGAVCCTTPLRLLIVRTCACGRLRRYRNRLRPRLRSGGDHRVERCAFVQSAKAVREKIA